MKLKKEIEEYIPVNEQEQKAKEQMLLFINTQENILERTNTLGHFTASAFIVNKQRTKMLVVYHNIFKGWIYPGGHADGNNNLLEVAIKETKEETGLDVKPLKEQIYSLQTLEIKAHTKNGKYISPHLHFDIVYIFEVDENLPIKYKKDESSGIKWITFKEANNKTMCEFIRPIHKKLINKLKDS